jgi:hypothetical protein
MISHIAFHIPFAIFPDLAYHPDGLRTAERMATSMSPPRFLSSVRDPKSQSREMEKSRIRIYVVLNCGQSWCNRLRVTTDPSLRCCKPCFTAEPLSLARFRLSSVHRGDLPRSLRIARTQNLFCALRAVCAYRLRPRGGPANERDRPFPNPE